MSDIVQRLRMARDQYGTPAEPEALEAASEIESLRATIVRLKKEVSRFSSGTTTNAVARNEALEDAAKLCDAEKEKRWKQSEMAQEGSLEWGEPRRAVIIQGCMSITASDLATAIRALKHEPEKNQGPLLKPEARKEGEGK